MVDIIEPGKKIENKDLDAFSNMIGFQLPRDYREHMLKYNGGHPEPNRIIIENHFEGEGSVAWFFSLGDENEGNNLEIAYEDLKGTIEKGLVPIGYSGSNDKILISVRSEDYGAVYWQDNKLLWEGVTGAKLYYKLADSLIEFLENLTDWPDD